MMGGMPRSARRLTPGQSLALSREALRLWGPRQVGFAVVASLVVAVAIGVATVLIPNPVFGRDIPPVWWNYPVWLVTSAFSGMLLATYVRHLGETRDGAVVGPDRAAAVREARSSRFGMTGGILAWFAVGCPVCNKLALIAFGYSGALTWFAPMQPFLAVAALVLTGVALVWRLRGQVACPVPARPAAVAS